MKITITGTNQDIGREVSVQIADDDLILPKILELIADALKGWGFEQSCVNRALQEEDDIERGRN